MNILGFGTLVEAFNLLLETTFCMLFSTFKGVPRDWDGWRPETKSTGQDKDGNDVTQLKAGPLISITVLDAIVKQARKECQLVSTQSTKGYNVQWLLGQRS